MPVEHARRIHGVRSYQFVSVSSWNCLFPFVSVAHRDQNRNERFLTDTDTNRYELIKTDQATKNYVIVTMPVGHAEQMYGVRSCQFVSVSGRNRLSPFISFAHRDENRNERFLTDTDTNRYDPIRTDQTAAKCSIVTMPVEHTEQIHGVRSDQFVSVSSWNCLFPFISVACGDKNRNELFLTDTDTNRYDPIKTDQATKNYVIVTMPVEHTEQIHGVRSHQFASVSGRSR